MSLRNLNLVFQLPDKSPNILIKVEKMQLQSTFSSKDFFNPTLRPTKNNKNSKNLNKWRYEGAVLLLNSHFNF